MEEAEVDGTPNSVDFGIVVALPLELEALLRHLGGIEKCEIANEDNCTYYVGSLGSKNSRAYSVVVTLSSSVGNVGAALSTRDLIARWAPTYVLMIGIAGGTKPDIQHHGDVLVTEEVLYYEHSKIKSGGAESRFTSMPANARLLDRARNFNDPKWSDRIKTPRPLGAGSPAPAVHFGPIASGEKVIASSEFVGSLLQMNSRIIGVEMETWGIAKATHSTPAVLGFLGIRGISDFADAKKGDDFQAYAAESAAAWTVSYLESAPVQTRSPDHSASAANPVQVGSDNVVLRWSGELGRRWRVEVNEDNRITTKINNRTQREKLTFRRHYDAEVTGRRANGTFRVKLLPKYLEVGTVRAEGSLSGVITSNNSPQVSSTGEMVAAEPVIRRTLDEMIQVQFVYEVSAQGVIVSAEASHNPFLTGKQDVGGGISEWEIWKWLTGIQDLPKWLGIVAFVELPTGAVRLGTKWHSNRKWNWMGLEMAGVSENRISRLDSHQGKGLVQVSERGRFGVDPRQMLDNLRAAFEVQEPAASLEFGHVPGTCFDIESDWTFDIAEGELVSRSLGKLSLDMEFTLSARMGQQVVSRNMRITSGGSTSLTWSRL